MAEPAENDIAAPAAASETPSPNRDLREALGPNLHWHSSILSGRFSLLMRVILRLFFRRYQVADADAKEIREAAKRGPILYVLRDRSRLEYLALAYILARQGLPAPRFAHYISMGLFVPWNQTLARAVAIVRSLLVRRRYPNPYKDGLLERLFENNVPSLLFVSDFRGMPRRFSSGNTDVLTEILRAQRDISRPIQVVPVACVYGRRPDQELDTLTDLLFGPTAHPGAIRRVWLAFRYRNSSTIRVGDVVSLEEIRHRLSPKIALSIDRPAALAYRIRQDLMARLDEERRVVLGPIRKTRQEIVEAALQNPSMVAYIRNYCKENNQSFVTTRARARRYLEEMAGDYDPMTIGLAESALDYLFEHKRSGSLSVDTESLDPVRKTARQMPLIYVPCHKSHLDYLLVSYILYKQKLSLPYILAGINLNFWPIGGIFRNCGAFFMRRVFKGKRIYSKSLNVYVSTLLREGIHIEFFVEGGRSRTGKLIPPKLGFISILLDAFRLSGREDMAFVPVTIDYERVFEEGFYLEEAGGKKKKRGKLRALIQNRHIIRRRIGHVDVTFAKPILLSDLLRENGHDHVPDDRIHQMSLASIIAAKTTWSISEHLQARPYPVVITALMATAKRGMLLPEVIERVELMMEYLHSRGARIQGSLWRQSDWVKMMLDLAEREKFIRVEPGDEDDDDTIIYLEPERRLLLTLRRNALLHHYQDVALLSTALLSAAGPIEIDALYERFQRIKHLLKLEMVYGDKPVQTPGEERGMFDDALEYFSGKGELAVSEQGLVLSAAGAKGAELFSAILVSYLESYYIVARTFWKHRDKDANDREWLRRCNKMGTFLHGLDEIVFPEAIHKNHFENAIKQLSADGALGLEDRVGEKSKLERRIVVTDEDKLEDLLNELRTFIAAR